MGRQIGGAIGLAALVTIASAVARHSHHAGPAAVVDGYHAALLVVAGVSLTAAAVSLLLKPATSIAAAAVAAPRTDAPAAV